MDLLGIIIFMGPLGLKQIPLHVYSSISTFVLAPIPMFIFMGEVMFHSGVAYNTINVIDRWLSRLPGRLGLLAAASGTLFAATRPEMKGRGYKPTMAVGPIVGVGGLAMLIPPSALAVVLASIGHISVSKILVGGVIPGLLLGSFFALYIIVRCWLNPSLAPPFETARTSLWDNIVASIKHVLPMGFIVFMVLGLILLGIATPSEAAASGVIATVLVTIFYGRFNWKMLKASLTGTLDISIMIFMIIAASKTFSSILAYTGATSGLLGMIEGAELHPLIILLSMQFVVFILGTFMETISIMMICLPIFMPIIKMLGFDPVWFGVLILINLEMGQITPPFGMLLFVMKGVAPPDITIQEICWAAFPYIIFDIIVMAMIILWPSLVLWLPSLLV